MKLAAYLNEHQLTDADFAELVGCDRTTILRLRTGKHKPSPPLMEEIAKKTGGLVQPNDYFDALPSSEAA
jgi:transcriptional regulator with XRE-family HTH domain